MNQISCVCTLIDTLSIWYGYFPILLVFSLSSHLFVLQSKSRAKKKYYWQQFINEQSLFHKFLLYTHSNTSIRVYIFSFSLIQIPYPSNSCIFKRRHCLRKRIWIIDFHSKRFSMAMNHASSLSGSQPQPVVLHFE